RPLTDFGGKTSIFSHSVYLFLREFSLQDSRGGSMDFNIMTRLDVCKAKVRIAERTFTTFGSRGGVVFVINGAWQLGDKLLTTDQGACWFDGRHTLRLLQPQGKLLFSEINWLAGHSPDQVQ
ncbi:HutD family protein, partial [Escherichia coli]